MSKWDKEYVLVIQDFGTSAKDKNIISDSAMSYVEYGHIPIAHRFSTRTRETSKRSFFDLRPFDFKGCFSPLSPTSLAPVTINDKLYVFAHGSKKEIGFAGAANMAGLLVSHGLRSVGLITFKACDAGRGHFLELFVGSLVRQGVTMGWAKAYRGSASTMNDDPSDRPTELIEKTIDEGKSTERDVEITGRRRIKIVTSSNNPYMSDVGRYHVA